MRAENYRQYIYIFVFILCYYANSTLVLLIDYGLEIWNITTSL